MSIDNELRNLRQEVDSLASIITQLVRALEQDDRLRERAEAAEEKERDRRHETISRILSDIKTANEACATALRDLPDRLLDHIERKIYELRIARYEAGLAGVSNQPAPLPPPPSAREPTGRILTLIAGKEDDSIALTPAQQHWLAKMGARLWKYKVHIGYAVVALSGWLSHAWGSIKLALMAWLGR